MANKLAGGSNPTTPTDPTNPSNPGTSYPAWDSSKVYVNGDIVSYNNNNYKAKWWTQGDKPGTSDVWELIGAATPTNPTTPSNPTTPTTPTNSSNPTDPTNPSDPSTSYPAWDSSKVYVNGDIVSYNNNNYKAKWWTQGDKPGASDVWELIGAATPTNPKY